jgi:hypothetical protein
METPEPDTMMLYSDCRKYFYYQQNNQVHISAYSVQHHKSLIQQSRVKCTEHGKFGHGDGRKIRKLHLRAVYDT